MIKLNFRRGGAFAKKSAKKYLDTVNPEDIKKVCVVRHAQIGDWIVARPFLIELKKYFPNAKITLSVNRSAMYGMPNDLVDDIHIMDKDNPNQKGKKTSLFYRIKQARTLPPQDILFDLTDSSMTLILTICAKAKLKIGYPYRSFRRCFYDICTLRSDFVFESMSMLHQLQILGANTKHYPLEYKLTDKTRDTQNPYVIYFGGASIPHRCWGDENFIQLIKQMKEKYPHYNHVILKGIKDDEHFNEVYEPFKNDTNVIHQEALPLEKIYDYLAGASLCIVGDTGLRNMALGTYTPTVGLMWATGLTPFRYLPKTENHQVVYTQDFKKPKVEDVFENCKKLMDSLYE